MLDLSTLDVQPTGFGKCGSCTYRDTGSAAICYACAAQTVDTIWGGEHCVSCDQRVPEGKKCINYWCSRSAEERGWNFIYAMAMRTGALETAINRYKFSDKRGWAAIFGRVLVGYLDDHHEEFDDVDLIVGCPTYIGEESQRKWDHIDEILTAACVEGGKRWPFDESTPRAIVKTADTPRMTTLSAAWARRDMAETKLRVALSVPNPARIFGKVMVVDDVFTDGTTLREVALKLRQAGAEEVIGVVLARQPWAY